MSADVTAGGSGAGRGDEAAQPPPLPPDHHRMGVGRIVVLVIGSLLIMPALGLLIGGGALMAAYAFGRDGDGYFTGSLDRVESPTAAVTAEDLDFTIDPGTPGWIVSQLTADVRLAVTDPTGTRSSFVGIGPEADVDRYLASVAHDQVTSIDNGRPVYRTQGGATSAPAPTTQTFWVVSASGPGTQRLDWTATSGRWSAVLMNSDGSGGVAADVTAGVKARFVPGLATILLGVGATLTAVAVALIVAAATAGRRRPGSAAPAGSLAAPGQPSPSGLSGLSSPSGLAVDDELEPLVASPVRLDASLDPGLSRGLWLVKWLLAIPHAVVLFFLWIAFAVLTVVAGFAILFTGRYPRRIFDFNVGVLRWHWRVTYYASSGGIGTDRYPPFSLGPVPGYPAQLDVAYPERLSRGLVLVKWWLLAIPHYIILGVLFGGMVSFGGSDRNGSGSTNGGPGLLTVLVLVAGVILLFTGRYPRRLFDLIVGFNRWLFRVIAYAALMTDQYPPFRLDQGGSEPTVDPGPTPPTSGPAATAEPAAVDPDRQPIPATV